MLDWGGYETKQRQYGPGAQICVSGVLYTCQSNGQWRNEALCTELRARHQQQQYKRDQLKSEYERLNSEVSDLQQRLKECKVLVLQDKMAADKAAADYEQSVIQGQQAGVIADTLTNVATAGAAGPAAVGKIYEYLSGATAKAAETAAINATNRFLTRERLNNAIDLANKTKAAQERWKSFLAIGGGVHMGADQLWKYCKGYVDEALDNLKRAADDARWLQNEQQKRCNAQAQQLAQRQADRDRVLKEVQDLDSEVMGVANRLGQECGESVGL
jgi:chromosome segregation ATPase